MAEQIVGWIFGAVIGACLASFANVLALRWHAESSIMGRSACPNCKRVLGPQHLVPIFSWLWQRGRCTTCGKKIHIQYPLVEVVGAWLGFIAAFRHQPFLMSEGPAFWLEVIFTVMLLVLIVMDIRWKELPVEFLAGLGILGGILNILGYGVLGPELSISARLASVLMGTTVATLFFSIQVLASRGRWLGIGDIWLGAFMGAVLGWPRLPIALYMAYVLGGGFAMIGLLSGRLKRGDQLPFAPALCAGYLFALWFGHHAYDWYTNLLG